MPKNNKKPIANILLACLSTEMHQELLLHSERVTLMANQVLYRAGEVITDVYFPINCIISLVSPIDEHAGLEVGLVGNEGMLGVTLLLESNIAPFDALVQAKGYALRIDSAMFLETLAQNSDLLHQLKLYLYVVIRQLGQTAACTRFHVVEERLARWLLMTQDRAHADNFHMTQVFLAYVLGVRRVGITKAANSLQQQQLIRYHRGDISIINRPGLEAASCGCYQADNEIYKRIIPIA